MNSKTFFILLLYTSMVHSTYYHYNNMIPIPPLTGNAHEITMQKTVIDDELVSIDILFGNFQKEHFFWQYNVNDPYSNSPKAMQTNATYLTDSINDNKNRAIAVNNAFIYSPLNGGLANTFSVHNKPIKKMKVDKNYIITQSTAENIRFWLKEDIKAPYPRAKDIIKKEISRAYLLDYCEGNALWAQRDFITGTMLNIHVGFDFSKQGKSFLFKKDIYNFVETKQIVSIPFVNDSYLPACFLAKDHAVIFNEYKKEIVVITYKEVKPQTASEIELLQGEIRQKKKNEEKKEGEIHIKSISLQSIKPSHSDDNPLEIFYRTPKKIDYNHYKKVILLIYDDRIIRCKNINNQYIYETIFDRNNNNFYIVDVLIHDHTRLYVLLYNEYEKKYYLFLPHIV